jgi:hypothetical protein
VGTVAFYSVPQATDVLRVTCGRDEVLQQFLLVAGTVLWGFATWYFARVMLQLQFRYRAPRDDQKLRKIDDWLVTWTPRILGVLPFATMFVALRISKSGASADGRVVADHLAFWTLAAGAAFFAFVVFRRSVLGLEDVTAVARSAPRLRNLSPTTRATLIVFLGIHIAFIVLFAAVPVGFGQTLGAATVLVVALATWISVGTAITYVGLRLNVPTMLPLVVLVVLASRCNDDHVAKAGPAVASRPSLEKDLEAWRASGGRDPVFVVATEGGGVRASYWTALVLSYLQDQIPSFKDHLYGVSSVSGGSVGAAMFLALLAENDKSGGGPLQPQARAALSADAVAPVLGKLLYTDLLQQFIPFPIPWFDRSTALEDAWAAALPAGAASLLRAPMSTVWQTQSLRPRLFLNATWVETGQRLVFSWPRMTDVCKDCTDGADLGDFGLVQAAHDSARFPYISPPATLERDGKAWGHVGDGGYFENSGTATGLDIIKKLRKLNADVRAIVIHIPPAESDTPERWLVEELTPPNTFLDVQNARASLSVETLEASLHDDHIAWCDLAEPPDFKLPLGWTLSSASTNWMDGQSSPCVPKGPGQGEKVQSSLFQAANVVRGWVGVPPVPPACPKP